MDEGVALSKLRDDLFSLNKLASEILEKTKEIDAQILEIIEIKLKKQELKLIQGEKHELP